MTATQLANALVEKGTVTVSLTKPHDPYIFYCLKMGLTGEDGFRCRIVNKATPIESAPDMTLRRFMIDLEGGASNEEIEAELGGNHLFTATEISWVIAELTSKQHPNVPGDLNTGTNLFYTPLFVVFMTPGLDLENHWKWSPSTCQRGPMKIPGASDNWSRGAFVFSRN